MGRVRAMGVALALVATGCGSNVPANGHCQSDSDCRLCQVCGCSKAYASADTAGATCEDIQAQSSCFRGVTADCLSGPLTALCVSGRCQAVASMR